MGSARHGERKIRADYREPRSLPLSMELLRRASEDLLSEYRYEDALVLLDFVHPEIWPYDHLLRSLAERAKDPAVQMAKHQKLVNLTLSFLKSREELIEKSQSQCILPLSEYTLDALQVLLKRGDLDDPGTKSELNAALERAKLHKECPQTPLHYTELLDQLLSAF